MKIEKSHIKWVIVTIVLGAVGSGAWEYILKPIALHATSFTLEVATLGVQSFKDNVYGEIAQGHHEAASLSHFLFILGLFPGMLTGALLGIRSIKFKSLEGPMTVDGSKKLFWIMALVTIFITTFAFVYASRVGYINRAITHFNQLLAIASPYLSPEDRIKAASQFAQIKKRDDYVAITADLTKKCTDNKVTPPSFSLW